MSRNLVTVTNAGQIDLSSSARAVAIGPLMAQVTTQPIKVPTWLVTAFICSQNSRIVFWDVSYHRMKKRRGLCRSGSGCCRRISSVTTSPKFFGVGRRSWGVVVAIWNKNILVRKPKGWGTSLFWFYLSIFNDSWVKQKEALLSSTPKYYALLCIIIIMQYYAYVRSILE